MNEEALKHLIVSEYESNVKRKDYRIGYKKILQLTTDRKLWLKSLYKK